MADLYGAKSDSYRQYNPSYAGDKNMQSSNIGRNLPRQMSSGIMRGTQGVGINGTLIDSSNNRIVITNPNDNTSIGMGSIPGTNNQEYGFFALNADGTLIMKIVNGTMFVYDPDTGKNTFQAGLLPDGTGGVAGANEGFDVADGFS